MEKTRDILHNLDCGVAALDVSIETLSDIESVLGSLTQEIEQAMIDGEEKIYYRHHARTIRLIWNLLRHSIKEMDGDCTKAKESYLELFDTLIKNKTA